MQTKQVKISFLNIELRAPTQRLPIHWLNFKNYYNANGKYPSNIEWMEPLFCVDNISFEDIVDYYVNQDSDVYAFSSYLWSHLAIKAVAQEIKKRKPNCIIVFGGPHLDITHNRLDWFKRHPYVDGVCEPTSYGEWFIEDLLDQMVESDKINWKEVTFSMYRYGNGKLKNKRDFKFPSGIIKGNEDIVFKCKDLALERNVPLVLPIELSRGCPYECVYCEWGGGIGGKVIRKDMSMIKEDLDYIPQFGIELVQILDANFGIFSDDPDVSMHIEKLKGAFGLPKHVEIYGLTKSQQEKRWATVEPLARAGVVDRYKLSLQTLNDEVLRNIKRTDIPREKDFEFAKYLQDTYNVRADFEFIMGLPGSTKKDFYDEIDIQYEFGYSLERYLWMFLPDSPAFAYDYRDKFKLKTARTCVGKTKMNSYAFDDVKNFDSYHITADERFMSDVEFVVEAEGYTKEEYTEFFFMNFWILQGFNGGFASEFNPMDVQHKLSIKSFSITSLVQHNIANGKLEKPSILYQHLYNKFSNPGNNKYSLAMKNLIDQVYDFICGKREEIIDYREFYLPHADRMAEMVYIFRACIYVFRDEYMALLKETCKDLNLDLPEEVIEAFNSEVAKATATASEKYDKWYQIVSYYDNFIKEYYA